ncbi:hypothetical protein FRB94_003146 [Tulasnella sp. JGI-2019a]|nr:hypothetical protein FRB93_005215 [Tulasnella sp. JGI-2019a]KAG9003378.1 hypothetical protein FRB94_003146 [Tulasnella sp. JGI-2019a]
MSTLWYWIQGVSSAPTSYIYESGENASDFRAYIEHRLARLEHFTPDALRFWKLKSPVSLDVDDIDESVQDIFEDMKDAGEQMKATHRPLSEFVATNSQRRQGEMMASFILFIQIARSIPPFVLEHARVPSERPIIRGDWCDRKSTVKTLHAKLQKYPRIQVRGTPASGKTTLLDLLHAYILDRNPLASVYVIRSWNRNSLLGISLEDRIAKILPEFPQRDTTKEYPYLLFDDAHDTYWDSDLWNQIIKENKRHRHRIVLFCAYGSPTSRPNEGTRAILPPSARVSLKPLATDENPPIGLLLNREEFDDLVSRFEYPICPSQGMQDLVYDWTSGHVGAAAGMLEMISLKASRLSESSPLTTEDFFKQWPIFIFAQDIQTWSFARGLPMRSDLTAPAQARVSRDLIANGSLIREIGNVEEELNQCFRRGWVHSELTSDEAHIQFAMASPLHASYVSWSLLESDTSLPYASVLDMAIAVIERFKPSQLALSLHRLGAAFARRPPEAQYQDEFYRAHFAVTTGTIRISPEFASAQGAAVHGQIDFFVPATKRGVKITRDGSKIEEYSARFVSGDAHGTWLTSGDMADYILLDCRLTRPEKSHPMIKNLYHVVFKDNYTAATMLDNELRVVKGFRLMEQ